MEIYNRIPAYIIHALEKLDQAGHDAYIVGGSIRDLLLSREISDYDLASSARPDQIRQVFKHYKTILTGIRYGTVTVVLSGQNVEITSFRKEGLYEDGRRPNQLEFTSQLEEDLSRRDFTINSMAYNQYGNLVDLFLGQEDLKKKLIRTVGNPHRRFGEDHLRILRAVRFAVQLGFDIEEETYQAAKELAPLLERISMERIQDEFFKIISSDQASRGIRILEDLKILHMIFPELVAMIGYDQKNPFHDKDLYEHTLCLLDETKPSLEGRLAALFHDIGKPSTFFQDQDGVGHFYGHQKVGAKMTEKIMNRLKASKELNKTVANFVYNHMAYLEDMGDKGLKRFINRIGKDKLPLMLDLQRADRFCTNEEADMTAFNRKVEDIGRILSSNQAIEKKQLAINGSDIIELGYDEGKIIGNILDYLMDLVLEDPSLNEREKLIALVRKEF